MSLRFVLSAAALALPMTAAAADEAAPVASLGNHPAVVAHLLAMPAPTTAALPQHPAVTVHSLSLGGLPDRSAAPKVQTAFTHIAMLPGNVRR